jgi:hypothetical protein
MKIPACFKLWPPILSGRSTSLPLLWNGTTIFDHDQKVAALWLSYKDRLRVSEFSDILYDLSELIQVVDLPVLDDPFSLEEINVVLKDMPSDHAPGLDGFNGAFFKKMLGYYKGGHSQTLC